ncbi:MAG: hypothetical protein ACI30I_00620 [Parabacteroides sp.]
MKTVWKWTAALLGAFCMACSQPKDSPVVSEPRAGKAPRLVNIVNFIRQTDYRVTDADRLMYETVCEQLKLVNRYQLPATFLLQYDALINPDYPALLKKELNEKGEIGAWWELTQPQVEAAGLAWRGRYSWDPEACVAFSVGYTNEEREKLVDVYMEKFKAVFGAYPKSVGSWFIDAHTLQYMYEKYHIEASCNCKDQVGTDGYTMWGGYWNQAYYPSCQNGYMPAQTEEGQIPVPVFRMLGSDPIYQYDEGIGGTRQAVISLEPVYAHAGRSRQWVDYYLDAIVNRPCLAFNYTQAGQENSFTWEPMREGLEMQIPLLDSLWRAGDIRLETLGESGRWFREQFPVTPPTAVTVLRDLDGGSNQTIWYNSRFYRINLLWSAEAFRIRDIHLFDEQFRSPYLDTPGRGNQFFYETLPFVDGFVWSDTTRLAGLRLVRLDGGETQEMVLRDLWVMEEDAQTMRLTCSDNEGHTFQMVLREGDFELFTPSSDCSFLWALELRTAPGKTLPFTQVDGKRLKAAFKGFEYQVDCTVGKWEKPASSAGYALRIYPDNHQVKLDFRNGK